VAGLAAIAYNRALLETIAAAERLGRLSVELRAGLIGAAVGTLAWFAPSVVGGGDAITQRSLVGAETLSVLPLVFLLRFGLGTVSYAAGTPGGLFAPMLALGAQLGLFLGLLCRLAFPDLDIQAEGFAVVDKFHRATLKATQAPKVQEKLATMGVDPLVLTPAELDAHVKNELSMNAALKDLPSSGWPPSSPAWCAPR
jgi:hypothetical protein